MPDVLDGLRRLSDNPFVEPEPVERLGRRIQRRRNRRRGTAVAAIAVVGAAFAFVAYQRDTQSQVRTAVNQPVTSSVPVPFDSVRIVVSSARGIDLVAANGATRHLSDTPTSIAFAMGDSLVIAAGVGESGSITVYDGTETRVLPSVAGKYVGLHDVGVVDGKPVALITAVTGSTMQDYNVEMYLVDIESGSRTDIGSVAGWEAGATGRLTSERVVLLESSAIYQSLAGRTLDGRVEWENAWTGEADRYGMAVVGTDLLKLTPVVKDQKYVPELGVTRIDQSTGAEIDARTLALQLDPGVDISGGICLGVAEWTGDALICNRPPEPPLLINLTSGETRTLAGVSAGFVTAVRTAPTAATTPNGPQSATAPQSAGEPTVHVSRPDFALEFDAPSSWTQTFPSYDQPVREARDGESGYVDASLGGSSVTEGSSDGFLAACQSDADHVLRPYGSSPKISLGTVDGHRACFIRPSSDAPLMPRRADSPLFAVASVRIELRTPVLVSATSTDQNNVVVYCDPDHLDSLATSIRIIGGH